VTVTVCPATVTLPVRDPLPEGLAATLSVTDPLPLPVLGLTVMNDAPLEAFHVGGSQSSGAAVTLTVAVPAPPPALTEGGETVNVQGGGPVATLTAAIVPAAAAPAIPAMAVVDSPPPAPPPAPPAPLVLLEAEALAAWAAWAAVAKFVWVIVAVAAWP
jgi:hypothetical protein